jgi:RHS repeat-associated protein
VVWGDQTVAENRLISATKSGATIAYQYDGDGNRVSKTVTGLGQMTTRYLVDTNNMTGYAQVVEELDAANTVQVVYTYGLDLISQDRKNDGDWTISYYGYDATGTTRMLFEESGILTDAYTHEAFGTIINRTGTTTNSYLFHGEQYDADLGLYYLRARYMDTNVGRFMTMDDANGDEECPLSFNKYVGYYDNSISFNDPSGEYGVFIGLALAIAMIGILSGGCSPRFYAHSRVPTLFVKSVITKNWEGTYKKINRKGMTGYEELLWVEKGRPDIKVTVKNVKWAKAATKKNADRYDYPTHPGTFSIVTSQSGNFPISIDPPWEFVPGTNDSGVRVHKMRFSEGCVVTGDDTTIIDRIKVNLKNNVEMKAKLSVLDNRTDEEKKKRPLPY